MQLFNTYVLAFAIGRAVNFVHAENTIHLSPKYSLSYAVNGPDMVYTIVLENKGWFGLGLNDIGAMNGADMAICTIENGKLKVEDYHGNGHSIVEDGHQDWHLVGKDSSINDTHVHVRIQRKLNTNDPNAGDDREIKNAEMFVIWAYGLSTQPSFHKDNKGAMKINFLRSEPSSTPKPDSVSTTGRPPATTPSDASGGNVFHSSTRLFLTVSALFIASFL